MKTRIKLINGWNKEKVMAQVMKYNNGRRAVLREDETSTCVYQTKEGNRCAVGCFIPDGHPALNSRLSGGSLIEKFEDLKEVMPFESHDIAIFQSAHDRAFGGDVYRSIDQFLDQEVD